MQNLLEKKNKKKRKGKKKGWESPWPPLGLRPIPAGRPTSPAWPAQLPEARPLPVPLVRAATGAPSPPNHLAVDEEDKVDPSPRRLGLLPSYPHSPPPLPLPSGFPLEHSPLSDPSKLAAVPRLSSRPPSPIRLAIEPIVSAAVVYPVPVREREPGATTGSGSSSPLSPLSPVTAVISGHLCAPKLSQAFRSRPVSSSLPPFFSSHRFALPSSLAAAAVAHRRLDPQSSWPRSPSSSTEHCTVPSTLRAA